MDYAKIVKDISDDLSVRSEIVFGDPDWDHISTSLVEQQNLTIRMSLRRYARRTNAHSKKFENHLHALALYFTWYNWMRVHETLRTTPAVAAGLTDDVLDLEWLLERIDLKDATILNGEAVTYDEEFGPVIGSPVVSTASL